VADFDSTTLNVPLSRLQPEEKAKRAGSFGVVASHYERYRPGPPVEAVDWIVPARVGRVVDLGAGTGALTRLLLNRADEVVAVEPDDRMRAVLTEQNPWVRALKGHGESIPLPDGCADVVVASSSWHWMDPAATLPEVQRVLVPGGILGVLWSGPDPEGPFLVHAQALLAQQPPSGDGDMAGLIMGDANRPMSSLEIPPNAPFPQPEHDVFRWNVALNADDLIGLLGTLSWIITMEDQTRLRVFAEARRLLKEYLGVEGDVTVDVAFRSDAWKSRRSP